MNKTLKGGYFWLKTNLRNGSERELKEQEIDFLFNKIKEIRIKERILHINHSDRLIAFPCDHVDTELTELDRIDELKNFYLGILINYRPGKPLLAQDDNGRVTLNRLEIQNNQNIVEMTYFILHKKTSIILVIQNKLAGNSKTFEEYFNSILNEKREVQDYFGDLNVASFSLIPVLENDAMTKLNNLLTMSKITMNFEVDSSWEQQDIFETQSAESQFLKKIDNILEDSGFKKVSIELCADRQSSMNKTFFQNIIGSLKGGTRRLMAKGLKLEGLNQFSNFEQIDFLCDKYIFNQEFPLENENNKYPDMKEVFSEMYKDFKNKIEKITNTLNDI